MNQLISVFQSHAAPIDTFISYDKDNPGQTRCRWFIIKQRCTAADRGRAGIKVFL